MIHHLEFVSCGMMILDGSVDVVLVANVMEVVVRNLEVGEARERVRGIVGLRRRGFVLWGDSGAGVGCCDLGLEL